MKKITKLVSGVMLFAVACLGTVQAATLTESQISALLGLLESFGADSTVITNVETTLRGGAPTNTGTPSRACVALSRSLYADTSDSTTAGEVTKLQQFLAKDASVYPEGLVTGYFGPMTERAVQRWQAKYGVVSSGTPDTTGYGFVGPSTRRAMGCISSATTGNVSSGKSETLTITRIHSETSDPGKINAGRGAVIYGTGLSEVKTVLVGYNAPYHVTPISSSDTYLHFVVPTYQQDGVRSIRVLNDKGELSNYYEINIVGTDVVDSNSAPTKPSCTLAVTEGVYEVGDQFGLTWTVSNAIKAEFITDSLRERAVKTASSASGVPYTNKTVVFKADTAGERTITMQVINANNQATYCSLDLVIHEKDSITPVINSVAPSEVSVGDTVTVVGKRLNGFEGDVYFFIKEINGKEIWLKKGTFVSGTNSSTGEQTVTFPITQQCQQNGKYWAESVGGYLECEYVEITSGTYKLYTRPWGSKSNELNITIR